MEKTYILDTNILLHDPKSIYSFVGNKVVVPLIVIEELDDKKTRQDMVGKNARVFANILDEFMENGEDLSEGVYLEESDITFKIEKNHNDLDLLPKYLPKDKPDNRILSVGLSYQKREDGPVILVSRDTDLRVKAHTMGLTVENYKSDMVELDDLYKGYETIYSPELDLNKFYKRGMLLIKDIEHILEEKGISLYPNQCFELNNGVSNGLGIYKKRRNAIVPIQKHYPFGLKSKNREQDFSLELLVDDNIDTVSLIGKSGVGKTLLALAVGLEKVVNEEQYDKLVILRPIVPMGNDIGYLPGDKDDKLKSWMKPIIDNLKYLLNMKNEDEMDITTKYLEKYVEMEAMTYIRGRSIPNQFIILDEAQNTSKHELKTVLTRAGEGSKVVLTGDPYQIDQPYLDSNTNGLTYVTDRLKEFNLTGSVRLPKGERSRLAELAANNL
jgi:PhoH-like ATPase